VILPIMATALRGTLPELSALGVMPSDPGAAILSLQLPEAVRRHAFIA